MSKNYYQVLDLEKRNMFSLNKSFDDMNCDIKVFCSNEIGLDNGYIVLAKYNSGIDSTFSKLSANSLNSNNIYAYSFKRQNKNNETERRVTIYSNMGKYNTNVNNGSNIVNTILKTGSKTRKKVIS